MKLHIKTRMIINGVLSVTISILLAMGIVYFLVQKQSKEGADGRIVHALEVVSAQLDSKKEKLVVAAESLSKSESLTNKLALIWDLMDIGEDVSYSSKEMAMDISDTCYVLGVRQGVVYDVNGKWVGATIIQGEEILLVAAAPPGSTKFFKVVVPVGKQALFSNFEEGSGDLPFPLSLPLPMPKESTTTLYTIGNELWISVNTPAISISEENKHRGQVVIGIPVD